MTRTPLFLALLSLSGALQAQTATPSAAPLAINDIPRIGAGIVIDGELGDAAWSEAGVFELPFEISPGDNLPAPAKTTARIGYTDDALYVSFVAQDPNPSEIRAHLRDRDSAFRDDFIGIILDTFDDQRRAYEFFVNPLGVQMDLINDQATSNEDDSWDGLWSSAGRITATGYEVEMRIPFSTLRFREGADAKRWAMSLFRSYPRSVRHQLTNHQVSRDSNCFLCTFPKFQGMAGIKPGHNLEVVPTITIGRPEFRDGPGDSWHNDGVNIEPGVDVSWAPTPNLTINGTINPDFSQVETDQAQLDLNSSFALFFPEKRPFFLEGADYFSTQFNVLYTRQIADPSWGLRITGRNGDGAYGAFVAQDTVTQLLVPGVLGSGFRILDQQTDVAVGRYRYNLNEHTTLGVIGTFRHGDDYSNDVVGVDGRWQKGAHTVTAQFLRSDSEYPEDSENPFPDVSPSGMAKRAGYNFSNRNWDFFVAHTDVDPGFRADLGFMGQVGYRKSLIGGSHTWYGKEGEKITRINLYSDWDITHRFDGQLLERELEGNINIQGPKQSNLNFSALTRVRFWQRSQDLFGQMFDEDSFGINGNINILPTARIGASINTGKRTDLREARTGRVLAVDVWGNIDLGRGLSIVPNGSWSRLRRDGGIAYTAMVFDTRISWQLDPRQRLRLTVQGSHIERDQSLYSDPVSKGGRDWGGQLLYSYKVNPHTAFYGGVSYGAVRDDNDENPDMFGNSRGVFMKYSYGWQPGG